MFLVFSVFSSSSVRVTFNYNAFACLRELRFTFFSRIVSDFSLLLLIIFVQNFFSSCRAVEDEPQFR